MVSNEEVMKELRRLENEVAGLKKALRETVELNKSVVSSMQREFNVVVNDLKGVIQELKEKQ